MSAILPGSLTRDAIEQWLYADGRRIAELRQADFPSVDPALIDDAADAAVRDAIERYGTSDFEAIRNRCRRAVRNKITDVTRASRVEIGRYETMPSVVTRCGRCRNSSDAAPFAALESSEFWEVACNGLTDRQAEAVILARCDGLTHEEAAERMGISRQKVSEHISKAEPIIRRNLEAYLAC